MKAKRSEKMEHPHDYISRGQVYEEKGDLDKAILNYTTAIESSPFYIHRYIRGDAYLKKGDYDRAIEDFTAVFETNAFFYEAIPRRGRAYHLKKELGRAIEDYTVFLMVYGLSAKGIRARLQEAIACVSPDSPAAVCGYRQLSHEEARSEFDKTDAKGRELPFDNIHNGSVHEARGEFDQAIAAYTVVLDDCPEHYLVRYFRGITYLKKGDYDQAIADFNAVLEISPFLPEVLSRRGRAYQLKNELERAVEDYTAFILLCPGSTRIRQNLKEIFEKIF